MKLSSRCRYATLALFDMAYFTPESGAQVRQIAERQNIPMRFLEQIFQDLRRAELVRGRRGRNGGYVLARTPRQITLLDIVLATDGPLTFGRESACQDDQSSNDFVVQAVWETLSDELHNVYQKFTLSDLVEKGTELGVPRGNPGYMYFI